MSAKLEYKKFGVILGEFGLFFVSLLYQRFYDVWWLELLRSSFKDCESYGHRFV